MILILRKADLSIVEIRSHLFEISLTQSQNLQQYNRCTMSYIIDTHACVHTHTQSHSHTHTLTVTHIVCTAESCHFRKFCQTQKGVGVVIVVSIVGLMP